MVYPLHGVTRFGLHPRLTYTDATDPRTYEATILRENYLPVIRWQLRA